MMTRSFTFKLESCLPITIRKLTDELDKEFEHMHRVLLGKGTWDIQKFKRASFEYFDLPSLPYTSHDAYFENFTVYWKKHCLDRGDYKHAEWIWQIAIETALEWEQTRKKRIHKGTPYYFLAVTSIVKGDIERGFALMSQAYSEDVITHGKEEVDTPAAKFLRFDADAEYQFFREELQRVKRFFENEVLKQGNLDYANFVRRFIRNIDVPSSTKFLFTYSVFRLDSIWQMRGVSSPDKPNIFLNLLTASLVFNLCKVLEDLLKTKTSCHNKKNEFSENLKRLAGKYVHTLDYGKNFKGDFNTDKFPGVLQDLIDRTYKVDGRCPDDRERALLISLGIRNCSGHLLEERLFIENLDLFVSSLISSIFLCLETYY
jgi:hypothetical protein